ncbi:hypothetical protein [Serratia rubidaea]|uniref:hypothetical protein n=1 Tax=Serratia rubidaea TaxID=61652 RepID=UPI00130EB8AA|nr:hypothetical protein [Serratia rubidaea]
MAQHTRLIGKSKHVVAAAGNVAMDEKTHKPLTKLINNVSFYVWLLMWGPSLPKFERRT